MVYAENFQNKYFQHTQKYIRFTGQSVLVNEKLTPEGRIFYIHLFRGGGGGGRWGVEWGARETRLSDNMTLE